MNAPLEEFESLLLDWEAGDLDDEGIARARELLKEHQEIRAFYLQQQVINAALKLDVDAGIAEPVETTSRRRSIVHPASVTRAKQHVLRISYWAAAAAVVLVCAMSARLLQLEYLTGQTTRRNSPYRHGPSQRIGGTHLRGDRDGHANC